METSKQAKIELRMNLSHLEMLKGNRWNRACNVLSIKDYANSFNPSTTIKYTLPSATQVKLNVFDILGHEVSVLVNEARNAGVYEVEFDGSSLASGVYFYRLRAGDFVQTRRLILLKERSTIREGLSNPTSATVWDLY